jgi:hypothetical protein
MVFGESGIRTLFFLLQKEWPYKRETSLLSYLNRKERK